MLQFRAKRDPGSSYGDRLGYLDDRTGSGNPFTRWLCHAIAYANYPLSVKDPNDLSNAESGIPSDPELAEARDKSEPTRGFPWLTLVLGSGCLEPRSSSSVEEIEGLPIAVSQALEDRDLLTDGSSPAEMGSEFAASLIRDRLGVEVDTSATHSPSALPTHAAELALVASLLSRFFHQAKALRGGAPSRWHDDTAELPLRAQVADEIRSAILQPVQELIDSLSESLSDRDPTERVVRRLLERISISISPPKGRPPLLHFGDLRVLSECTWFYLTRTSSIYPGWSDLLLSLSMHDGLLREPRSDQPRPNFDSLDFAPSQIRDRYLKVTRTSWDTNDSQSSLDASLSSRAAEVVQAQARLRSDSSTPASRRLPIASLFTTTFDLEVEMALCARPDATPFVMAIPVYVFRGEGDDPDRRASLCWLGALVNPNLELEHEEQLQQLLRPAKWFALSKMSAFEKEYGHLPIVVRLSGCPLIELPDIGDGAGHISSTELGEFLEAENIADRTTSPISIGHAVLLDEYAAMQQTAVENSVFGGVAHYGLPSEITGVLNLRTYSRFWMVMGVQMGDSGVRYRVTSQIASPVAALKQGSSLRRPRRAGVVINRRLDVSDQDLLYWYNFDVVRVPCQEFADDLDHYVRHLESPSLRTQMGTACQIA